MSAFAFLTKEFWSEQSRNERRAAAAAIKAAEEDDSDVVIAPDEADGEDAQEEDAAPAEGAGSDEPNPEQEQAASRIEQLEARLAALESPVVAASAPAEISASAKEFGIRAVKSGAALPFNADGYAKAYDIMSNVIGMAKASGNEDAVFITGTDGKCQSILDVFCEAVCPQSEANPMLREGAMAGKTRGASVFGLKTETSASEFRTMSDDEIAGILNNVAPKKASKGKAQTAA